MLAACGILKAEVGAMHTKEQLLALLENHRGQFFSGEEIARRLELSRTAVWKAVKTLRAEGYPIEAVQNRGYCLSAESDVLSAQGVAKYLGPACAGRASGTSTPSSPTPTLPASASTRSSASAAWGGCSTAPTSSGGGRGCPPGGCPCARGAPFPRRPAPSTRQRWRTSSQAMTDEPGGPARKGAGRFAGRIVNLVKDRG